jgi:hypothetical protein
MHALLQLLNSDNYRTYNLYVAKRLGSVNASIILCELIQRYAYHLDNNNLIKLRNQDGLWFYFTQEKCEERTALSRREQDSAIKNLEAHGLIKKINSGVPCTRHFQIDEAQIFEFFKLMERKTSSFLTDNPVTQKRQTVCTKRTNCIDRKRQTTKETKEELQDKKATSSRRKSSSFHPLDRNLEQLNALELDLAQKQTLYENFDDETILNAIAYYTSSKTEPDNLGAFLFAACRRNWKPSVKKAVIVKPKALVVNSNDKPSPSQLMPVAKTELNTHQTADIVCKARCQSVDQQNFNPIQELEDLALSEKQKEKIYADFEAENILEGLAWLRGVKNRKDLGASLYDAIKNNYQPKKSDSQRVADNQKLAEKMLGKYEDKIVRGLKIEIFKEWVSFSSPTGYSKMIEYHLNHFQDELESICEKLNLN